MRELLYDAGHHHLPAPMTATAMMPSRGLDTPETYLNPERASLLQKLKLGTADYVYNKGLTLNQFALNGTWTATKQYITPAGSEATIRGDFQAQHVYLVLTSIGRPPAAGQAAAQRAAAHPARGGRRRPRVDRGGPRPAPLLPALAARRTRWAP